MKMIKNIRICLLAAMLMIVGTANAGSDYYSKAVAKIGTTYAGRGKVYVNAPNVGNSHTNGAANASSATATVSKDHQTSIPTHTYTYGATAEAGYKFTGWYANSSYSGNPESTQSSWSHGVSGVASSSYDGLSNYEYWAKFDPVTVNSVASNSNPTNKPLSFTYPRTQTATVVFNVSNADETADFDTPTISGDGWSFNTWSYSNNQITVSVNFTANSSTTKGTYTATVTLTSKGTSDNQSKEATVAANVDLTPILTYNNGSVDISTSDADKTLINVDTLRTKYEGQDGTAGDGTITYALKSANSNASVTSAGIFYAKAEGTYTIVASATKGRYYAKTAEFTVTVGKRTPTFDWKSFTNIYAGDVLENVAQAKYNGNNVNGLSYTYTSRNTTYVVVEGTDLRIPTTGFNTANTVRVVVATEANEWYKAAKDSNEYYIEPKKTALFKLNGVDLPESPIAELHLLIGETANMTFVNTDESNGLFTYPTTPKYVTYTHDSEHHTGVIEGKAAGNEYIQFQQTGTTTIFGHTRSIHVYVNKHAVELSTTMNAGTWKVDSIYDGALYSLSDTPEGEEPEQSDVLISSGNKSVIDFVDGHWKAVGAGTSVMTFAMKNNDYWTGDTITATITVEKYTPEFDWNLPATVNYNRAFTTPVSSTNTMEGCTFSYVSGDPSVINWTNNTLRTFEKAGSHVGVTVTQEGNYKWNSKTQTFYVDVAKLPNHVEFTVNSEAVYNAVYANKQGEVAWAGSDGIRLGGSSTKITGGPAYNWEDKYIIINFTGIPKKISFTTGLTSNLATAGINGNGFWYMEQKSETGNWSNVWTEESSNNPGSISKDLNPDTRYVKICYTGNFAGYVKNLKITERTEIRSGKDKLDFGSADAGSDATSQNVNISWYNVNPLTLSIVGGDGKYSVSPASMESSKDQYAVGVPVTVSYKHDAGGTHNATLRITDGDVTKEISLTGTTNKVTPEITWKENLSPMSRGENVTDPAVALVALTYESSDSTVVDVDGNVLKPLKKGNATITALYDGSESLVYNSNSSTIDVLVTNLAVQHIHWTQTFTRLKWSNDEVLSEKNTPDFDFDATVSYYDPETEQEVEITDRAISYTSGNTEVVQVLEGNKLHVVGQGNTTLTAHIDGLTDSLYEATVVRDVIVREPTLDCEKWVLENKSASMATEINSFSGVETVYALSGEPGYLSFEAWREAIHVIKDWTDGNLFVAEYVNSEWQEITGNDGLALDLNYANRKAFDSIPLSREATQVKIFKKTGSTGIHAFSNAYVTLARYLELENTKNKKTHSIDLNTTEAKPGVAVEKTFTVNYSNITDQLDVDLKHGDKFSIVSAPTIGNECGDKGTATVRVRFLSNDVDLYRDTLLVHNLTDTVMVYLSADVDKHQQQITWNPATLNLNTTDNVTFDATTSASAANLSVSYYVTEGTAATVNETTGELSIVTEGSVTVEARCAGNDKYYNATPVSNTFVISKVKPTITEIPTAATMTLPNTNLGSCGLTGGEATVGGSFAWEDNTINATLNNEGYTVVFTPENSNWYTTATCTVVVPVNKQENEITWNFNVAEMYCNADYTFDAFATSGMDVRYETSDNQVAYVDDNNHLSIIKGGEVTITAYEDGDEDWDAATPISKTFTILRFTPEIITLPTAESILIGRLLDDASLTGGLVELDNAPVEGGFAWVDGHTTPMNVAGEFTKDIVFNPSNTNWYEPVYGTMTVVVEKYAPKLTNIALSGSMINYGQALINSTLSGTLTATDTVKVPNVSVAGAFAWKDETVIPNAGNPSYAKAVFVPENTDWYTEVEIEIVPLEVNKVSAASYTATATIVYGERLSEANDRFTNTTTGLMGEHVSGTITWAESVDQTQVLTEGDHQIAIRFHSTNANYVDGDGICTLTVTPGVVFNGGTDNTWDEDGNWLGGNEPGANDRVTVAADVVISGDVTIGGLTINEGYTVTVTEGSTLTIGNEDSFLRDGYGNLYVENGGQVVLGNGELKVNNFVLEAQLGDNTNANPASSGQVEGAEKLNVNGDAYFRISFDPRGAIDYGWYDFTVPFEVDALSGVYDANGNKLTYNVDYAIMDFSEEKRAVNGKYWNWFSGTLQPNRLYSITLEETKTWNTFLFKRKSSTASYGSDAYNALCSNNGETNDRGWNGMGNGTLHHCQLNNLPAQTKIQVYDHANDRYVERDADEYTYAVGTAFFVQVDEAKDVDLTAVDDTREFLAPARNSGRTFDEFRLALSMEGTTNVADHLWVSASEDATGEYVIGRDLLKMGTPTNAKVAQMWTSNYGLTLCDLEMPLVNDEAICTLGLFAPNAGSYELKIERGPQDADLYLTYNENVIWDLTASPYTFDLSKGTTTGYGLRIEVKKTPQVMTGVEQSEVSDQNSARKVIIDNKMYIITPEGAMYDVVGKSVKY